MVVRGRRVRDILSGLFAAEHLGQLKSRPSTQQVRAAREVLSDTLPPIGDLTVASLLDIAFEYLVREFPVEYIFKSCALERLLFGRHSPKTTAFYTEFRVGDSRVDVLLVNGRAHVYEIKTRYDDLSRLTSQLHDYYRAFTHVTLFVDPAHAAVAAKHTPEHTGIVILSNKYSMRTVRPAVEHREKLDHFHLFRMLHEREYIAILRAQGIDPELIDPAFRYRYCLDAFSRLDIQKAHSCAVMALKRRQRTVKLAEIAGSLPRSLRLAPFAHRMTLADWSSLSAQMCLNV
jgi:hypothetical protein